MNTYSAVTVVFDSSSAHQCPSAFRMEYAKSRARIAASIAPSTSSPAGSRRRTCRSGEPEGVSRSIAATDHLPSRRDDGPKNVLRGRHAVGHGRGLVAAMDHAIATLPVAAGDAVLRPVGLLQELL